MEGNIVDVEFTTYVHAFDLDFEFHSNALAVLSAENSFETEFDGFIGIAPMTSLNETERDKNFVYGLK